MARRMQGTRVMNAADDLAELDAAWEGISTNPVEEPPESGVNHAKPTQSHGAFGHATDRRLGLRVPASLWVLVKDGERSLYAHTVELSTTGAVLKLLDGNETRFESARTFELDIFVPGASRPLHAVAWAVRPIGQLEAFEFLTMSASDRLTLAEHLDHLDVAKPIAKPPFVEKRTATPPASWRNFVLSLKQSNPPATPVNASGR
jgi:hypothetical protein